jgi:hypothetical protein
MSDEGRATLHVEVLLVAVARQRVAEGDGERCWRLLHDLSSDQLRFRGTLPYDVGTRVKLIWELPFDPPSRVEVVGVVQRNAGRPSEVGLIDVPDPSREAIRRYLDEELSGM